MFSVRDKKSLFKINIDLNVLALNIKIRPGSAQPGLALRVDHCRKKGITFGFRFMWSEFTRNRSRKLMIIMLSRILANDF